MRFLLLLPLLRVLANPIPLSIGHLRLLELDGQDPLANHRSGECRLGDISADVSAHPIQSSYVDQTGPENGGGQAASHLVTVVHRSAGSEQCCPQQDKEASAIVHASDTCCQFESTEDDISLHSTTKHKHSRPTTDDTSEPESDSSATVDSGPSASVSASVTTPSDSASTSASGDTASASPSPSSSTSSSTSGNATTPVQSENSGGAHFTSPHQVIYALNPLPNNGFPTVAEMGKFNRLVLAFYETGGYEGATNIQNWIAMDAGKRKTLLDSYHAAGIAVTISVFGGTDKPTSSGVDPAEFASKIATFAKQYQFDGVDVDYEDFDAFEARTASASIIKFQTALRSGLGSTALISHAPIAPWFRGSSFTDGAYQAVLKTVGNSIDFFNVQFYNQEDAYQTCQTLITNSDSTKYPGTSLAQLQKLGLPFEKLVLGKPANAAAAETGGYMPPSTLAQCVAEGAKLGWPKQVMFWEWAPESVNKPELIATVLGEPASGASGASNGSSEGSTSSSVSGSDASLSPASATSDAIGKASTIVSSDIASASTFTPSASTDAGMGDDMPSSPTPASRTTLADGGGDTTASAASAPANAHSANPTEDPSPSTGEDDNSAPTNGLATNAAATGRDGASPSGVGSSGSNVGPE